MIVRYLTHPQVAVDPETPVPQWGLSEVGKARIQSLIERGVLAGTRTVVSSAERKAIETAEPIALWLGVDFAVREAMHENDRSATGYLPPEEFERVADAFFSRPTESVRGWERAADAQARIVREVSDVWRLAPHGDVLFVGHGAVGTLLYCHLAGLAIDRRHDQPAGGGNMFAVERRGGRILHGWSPMETARVER